MIHVAHLSGSLTLAVLLTGCSPTCGEGENTSIDLDANGVADCAETLVKNSQFVGGIQPNAAGPEAQIALDSADAQGFAGSASMKVTNTASTNVPTIRAGRQCIRLIPEQRYVIAGQFYITPGHAINGLGAQIEVRLFSEPSCAGGEGSAQVTDIVMTEGSWQSVKDEITSPRANSAYFEASVRKSANQPGASILFDNLLIHQL